jgi:hypothetical protein
MADSKKRNAWAKDAAAQDRIRYYLFAHSMTVFGQDNPDTNDLAFAKKVYRGEAPLYPMACVLMANTDIGATIDSDGVPTDSDIEWAIVTDNQFNKMAQADAEGSA